MTTEALIIGDIAGQYKALLRLLAKCPDYMPISVGDMIDRGPDSRRVMDHFMVHGKAVLGNHEHMMLDFCTGRYYQDGTWLYNGGGKTLKSMRRGITNTKMANMSAQQLYRLVPDTYRDWLNELPLYIELDGKALITHAPLHPDLTLDQACNIAHNVGFIGTYESTAKYSILWNRIYPIRRDKYQIYGHNGYHCYHRDDDKGEFAVCVDNSRNNQLCALVWPTGEIITESF